MNDSPTPRDAIASKKKKHLKQNQFVIENSLNIRFKCQQDCLCQGQAQLGQRFFLFFHPKVKSLGKPSKKNVDFFHTFSFFFFEGFP